MQNNLLNEKEDIICVFTPVHTGLKNIVLLFMDQLRQNVYLRLDYGLDMFGKWCRKFLILKIIENVLK